MRAWCLVGTNEPFFHLTASCGWDMNAVKQCWCLCPCCALIFHWGATHKTTKCKTKTIWGKMTVRWLGANQVTSQGLFQQFKGASNSRILWRPAGLRVSTSFTDVALKWHFQGCFIPRMLCGWSGTWFSRQRQGRGSYTLGSINQIAQINQSVLIDQDDRTRTWTWVSLQYIVHNLSDFC